tara:strand:+ start:1609 stop:2163 length:555 start_codon:yes stop_codon:yes gene_type:complete
LNTLSLNEKLINFNSKNRRNDAFYVKFYGIPENFSNVLGKQVKNFVRPNIDMETSITAHRGARYKDSQKITLAPVTVAFNDDEESLVSMFLYIQLFRQMNKYPDKFGKLGFGRDYKFDVEMVLYNANREVTEKFTLIDCFIQNINHSDPNLSDSSETEIAVTLEYDNIDVWLFDEYIRLKDNVG